ncbi:MAG TPA: serine--tRNA ligase [Thermomicrobiales bacterium]|nr:serine--tRNA ligase [Thermomicrobiales bacterium]
MLDIKVIRENPDEFSRRIATKGVDVPVDRILELDERRRSMITEVERIKAERNAGSKLVGKTKDPEERQRLIAEMQGLGDKIAELDAEVRKTDAELQDLMLNVPNLPDEDVPVGLDETANVVRDTQGPEREFDFEPKPHWDLAEELGIIDFERGVKVAGTRGYVLRGDGAKLQRALVQWMLDVHTTRHGYSEVAPPYQVLGEMLVGTGNLPKFADTLFRDAEEDRWLIPTAEVPVTNLYRDEILDESMLPIYHVAATPCFRREQISAGRDVRGIKRVYEFWKVELVKFVKPEESDTELKRLMDEALYIVNQLGLRYRILDLSTGDMTFSSAHTFDIETWAPGSGEWLEISSCSNFRDFQARRANLKYRPAGGRPQFLNTLNGSGLAIPRIIIAIMENYQREDGTIEIPEVLRPYFGGRDTIGKQPPFGPSAHQIEG